MIYFNSPNISQQSHTAILINQHVTVQAASEATAYNIQYLRRLLRSGNQYSRIPDLIINPYLLVQSIQVQVDGST
jgi:hypothetical protein